MRLSVEAECPDEIIREYGKVQRIVAYPQETYHSLQSSQRCHALTFKACVLSLDNGEIRTAHCTCHDRLGEACSHIAALLFKVELAVAIDLTAGSTEKAACGTIVSPKCINNQN